MREKIVEDVPVYNPIISNPSWLPAGGFGAASSDPKDFNVSEEDTLLEEDPNKGKKGFHFDAASGKWVPDTLASEEDPNKGKAGFHLDPATGKWVPDVSGGSKKVFKSTYTDPKTGDIIDIYDNGDGTTSETVRKKGTLVQDAEAAADAAKTAQTAARQSAYDLLYEEFDKYGLGALVESIKDLIMSGVPKSEYTMRLRGSKIYEKRFAGNAARVAKGLRALSEAAYIDLEDQYQNVMRNYGLPATYWEKDAIGTQKGFIDLIANDVSSTELEKRIQTATDFIDKGPKAYVDAIKQFYPEISRGDLLSYVLDPENALPKIQSKIGAAKIGGEYLNAGLTADQKRAEELQRYGVTAEAARQGAQTVKDIAPRGSELAAIYKQSPYGQSDVEEEVYGLGKANEAKKKREKLLSLENASFSGQAGRGAIARDSAGLY